jgi:hypothetical protein
VSPCECHQPFALVSLARPISAPVSSGVAPYSSHIARTSRPRTAPRPYSIRHTFCRLHCNASATPSNVIRASVRSSRSARPSCRRGTVDLSGTGGGSVSSGQLGPHASDDRRSGTISAVTSNASSHKRRPQPPTRLVYGHAKAHDCLAFADADTAAEKAAEIRRDRLCPYLGRSP